MVVVVEEGAVVFDGVEVLAGVEDVEVVGLEVAGAVFDVWG